MCKHHWMLGMTTPTGTPAHCKKCGKDRVFRAQGVWGTDLRKHPHIEPSRVSKAELSFNPSGPRRSTRIRGTRI